MTDDATLDSGGAIAVIGLAGRFPGADDVATFWSNLVGGVESLTVFEPGTLNSRTPLDHIPTAGVVDGADYFDAGFFGCSPAEALILDPQHRLFLQTAWSALEDAACDPFSYPGAIGIYGGSTESGYLDRLRAHRERLPAVNDFQLRLATGIDFLTTRVAYKLGLRGPAVTVQTACSTSLVAIHLAAQALLAGECDVALAGGVTIPSVPEPGDYDAGGIVSADGHCRAFDADAAGTVSGSGVGIVVLKRLAEAVADGDQIRAVLLGSAVNNDAAQKVGFAAPSIEGQAQVISTAQLIAGVEAASIGYVEAHGTATPLGDPIEVAALTRAFRRSTSRRGFCRLGSVKTNIGHADAAAGVAGFMKAVLSVQHGLIPPSLHFRSPNPALEMADSPFVVPTELTPWPAQQTPRRAGVSAFGIGGTNAHAVLEEPPVRRTDPEPDPQLLVLSARTEHALDARATQLGSRLRADPGLALADVAWTLQTGRAALQHRGFLVCDSIENATAALTAPTCQIQRSPDRPTDLTRRVVFMFPGQGGQHVDMARGLYESEPVFRAELDAVVDLVGTDLDLDLRDVLYPAAAGPARAMATVQLGRMSVGQPAVFAVEYALAKLWQHWGVQPAGVVGHSLGAYAAACLAGVMSLADIVSLVVERGRLLDQLPPGAMLAVPLPEAEVQELLGAELSVAAVNHPSQTVVSGPAELVARLQARLADRSVDARRLNISTAAHSLLVEPIVDTVNRLIMRCERTDPTIPFLSDTTGAWTEPGQLLAADYWGSHLRRPVRFADALATLASSPEVTLLEVGPGRTLATLARQHPALARHTVAHSLPHPAEHGSDRTSLLTAAGRLWSDGVSLDWAALHRGRRRGKVSLPTYPFQQRRYSLVAGPGDAAADLGAQGLAADSPSADDGWTATERSVARLFGRVLGLFQVAREDGFFELGGDSLIASQLIGLVSDAWEITISTATLYQFPTVALLAHRIDQLISCASSPTIESTGRPAAPTPLKHDPSRGRRLVCRVRRPEASHRLYCFPHSGGSAGEFVRWAEGLPELEVLGLQLPGRGARLSEPAFTRMGPLVDDLVTNVSFEKPFAFFGHSLGALVAYEVSRSLRAAGKAGPTHLFASACAAPQLQESGPEVHRLPDDELAAWIEGEYGSLGPELMSSPELLRTSLPAHRADFELVETYHHQSGSPLEIPITVIGGMEDDLTRAELAAWARQTTVEIDIVLLPGDHFYFRQQQSAVWEVITHRIRAGNNQNPPRTGTSPGRTAVNR